MATLTSTGINCSDGTLDGQYTGTSNTNTSYPIGSFVMCGYATYISLIARNATGTVYNLNNYVSFAYLLSNPFGTATALSGTWRARGGMTVTGSGCGEYNSQLMQRVA